MYIYYHNDFIQLQKLYFFFNINLYIHYFSVDLKYT